MLFNSLHFLIFFPIVVLIYFLVPRRYRWILLLIASYYFYMSWKAEYAILILISTVVDYFAGRRMGRLRKKEKRVKYLLLSIFANIGLLFSFKYFNFFNDTIRNFLDIFSISFNLPYLNVLLPVGISFYTFQTLSYSIDVYRGRIRPEKHFGIFAVYVSFFPQLVAGPIERANRLIPQFYKKHEFVFKRLMAGLRIMLWGFFLKVVIADRLALVVDPIYNNVLEYTGIPLIVATYFFAWQIYCDFAGYSFIAIGAAKVMGINLMDNFKRPYFSKSISEFWKRWHISLSTWFRDYLYIPLGGNRVKYSRWIFNLFIVFLISGLWHGAALNFIVWGALHGAYLIFGIFIGQIRKKYQKKKKKEKFEKIKKFLKVILTFHLVLIAWIFFRANNLSDAWYILTHLFSGWSFDVSSVYQYIGWYGLILAIVFVIFMEGVHLFQERGSISTFLNNRPRWVRWIVYLIFILIILLFGVFNENKFIYFQF